MLGKDSDLESGKRAVRIHFALGEIANCIRDRHWKRALQLVSEIEQDIRYLRGERVELSPDQDPFSDVNNDPSIPPSSDPFADDDQEE